MIDSIIYTPELTSIIYKEIWPQRKNSISVSYVLFAIGIYWKRMPCSFFYYYFICQVWHFIVSGFEKKNVIYAHWHDTAVSLWNFQVYKKVYLYLSRTANATAAHKFHIIVQNVGLNGNIWHDQKTSRAKFFNCSK